MSEARAISADDFYPRRKELVNGCKMACIDTGSGRPVVFLHGNPTSSYIWRNIIPHVEGIARCIAPDLIGMGLSDKLPSSNDVAYRYIIHRQFLNGLLTKLDLEDGIVLVGQDWGSVLAFDWARHNEDRIAAIEDVLLPDIIA